MMMVRKGTSGMRNDFAKADNTETISREKSTLQVLIIN